eukprot:TRINITY_DN7163_c0_g1_i1.p1 TRINITY_DN7163_c0_g1~~TRINITY_DN7163_c0_g1_i1.p1  ORF type:complete len:585 (-),score=191.54 TRINITY_DN7163_c0_g1_i1:6-1760(-)
MTHPTKAIYKMLLSDYVKMNNISAEDSLYVEQDLINSMEKIEVINYHQEIEVGGIKFWCYNAGHVLGAAMFMLEIDGVKILYTGDFSRQEDRHLMAAEIPDMSPDVLIVESTYGVQTHDPRIEREKRFSHFVHEIVKKEGRCLIPVFALGRAQELLLILDEYWQAHPELWNVPIYYASSLAKKCMAVYQTYLNMMNDRIRQQIQISNPFIFKHISSLKGMGSFQDVGPCVVMASPGMLQSGLSRELFELWCSDKRNGVLIPGYCVEGTLAKTIIAQPDSVQLLSGQVVPLRMSVNYISFSAHSDYTQTSEFIDILKPSYIVLVHGEMNEMNRLNNALTDRHKSTKIFAPKNGVPVRLVFKSEKHSKVVGKLASEPPSDGKRVAGIIVQKDFNHHIMESADLSNFTQLTTSKVVQKIHIPYQQNFSIALNALKEMYEMVVDIDQTELSSTKTQGKEAYRVCDVVDVVQFDENSVLLEWVSNPVNDMIADSITALLLQSQSNPAPLRPKMESEDQFVVNFMKKQFGNAMKVEGSNIEINLNGKLCKIIRNGRRVECEDEELKKRITEHLQRVEMAVGPIPETLVLQ